MSSPASIFLKELRLQLGVTQLELARAMGYEQAYVSTIELGIKSPSKEFVTKLVAVAQLGVDDQQKLEHAMQASNRRFVLPPDASTNTYRFCNDLWSKLEKLHPALLEAMHLMLSVEDRVAERVRIQPDRLKRRDKQEAPM